MTNPTNKSAEKDHLDLCEAAQTIGNIAGCNWLYTHRLTSRIAKTGKPLMSLTLAELIELDKQETAKFNNDEFKDA